MRIGGLATGMDIDSIVRNLMQAERIPLTKLSQDRQLLEWKRDEYRNMNSLLLNFRQNLTDMRMTSSYRARTVTSSNENLVSATVSSSADQTSYTISSVSQLASAASKVNGGSVFTDTSVDTKKSLYQLTGEFSNQDWTWNSGSVEKKTISVDAASDTFSLELADGIQMKNADTEMSVKVNGKSYEVVTTGTQADLTDNQVLVDDNGNLTFKNELSAGSTISANYITTGRVDTFNPTEDTQTLQLTKKSIVEGSATITVDGNTTYTTNNGDVLNDANEVVGSIDHNTGEITFDETKVTIKAGSNVDVSYEQNYTSFKVGAHTSSGYKEELFNVEGSSTLSNVTSHVNNSGVGVNMFYDSATGQMSMTRTETGNYNGLDPNDADYSAADHDITTSGDFINKGLRFGGVEETGGQNAKFTINGMETERKTNTFDMSGVTFTLKQAFTDQSVDITVNNDTQSVVDKIKGFVDIYNTLIGSIQDKINEPRYRDYKPLGDEERQGMSDKQAEMWEERARSGMLRRDTILSGALTSMRNDLYSRVQDADIPSEYQQLTGIGITTTSNYREGGKLQINESKLKEALENDPDAVEKLFMNKGTGNGDEGIITRLADTVSDTMSRITDRAGNSFRTNDQYSLGRQIKDMNNRIRSFEQRLVSVEDRYWNQFTAMEKAIQQMNSQSMQLMQQFGGGMMM
ncbi:flagellar filament capping protein FliD [Salirhabdus salicampi]|uniref:flagellar filament capping protein FliD n=1 Tax=Salirhabdus salicampi TaxID=476102 RepID=UPI0020C3F280|nr:flagellar filament capping protein FliD [Salirhabdus salicampi]MCP8617607.1 flagellar filament capping protein FliD [Salirhabdus salicampi]